MEFYTVSAKFSWSQYEDLEVESFLKLENANKFAEEQWEVFLSKIQDRKLDKEQTEEEINDGLRRYYGVDEDGENIVGIDVVKTTFKDEEIEKGPLETSSRHSQ